MRLGVAEEDSAVSAGCRPFMRYEDVRRPEKYHLSYTTPMPILPASDETLDMATQILLAGGTIVHATETCYGIACDLTNRDAVTTLFEVKKRSHDKPVSALFASVNEAKKYVQWNEAADQLAKQHLPGPLTIILRVRPDTPSPLFVTPHPADHLLNQTIGVRISSHPVAQELCTRAQKPLSTTSANISDEPSPYSTQEITKQFEHSTPKPELVMDAGVLPFQPPSTIIDCTSGMMHMVRQGSIRLEERIKK